jgi:NADH:ubiquinone oxidoreductase subunit F (NADH-binding)
MYEKTVFIKDTNPGKNEKTRDLYNQFLERLRALGLADKVQLVRVADMGVYDKGFVVRVWPDDVTYVNVDSTGVDRIIEETVKSGRKIQDAQVSEPAKQLKVVLRNCGRIDPCEIRDYIANDGYQGLKKVLSGMAPDEVVGELKISGLRGRGGGGFPTWMKWDFARRMNSDQKYIVCNGDEGDPGAYMDRSVLEGDPHSVLEGMVIAGYTIGASKGYLYIRAEYPLAIERIENAIRQAREYGLLGENILGTGFSFDCEVRLGAGAFVCGEETALIASIEGKRGTPSPRPPYPAVKGLWGKPTVINNVETLANLPVIFHRGGAWFAGIGTEKSKGTKVFALTGKVCNSGLIEVPMGITLREIVYEIGGGIANDRQLKAVQTGGPSGGVIPKEFLDTPVDYENLQNMGSIMGSGGMIVMDDTDCMVDIAKFYLGFCVEESCGKCAPCRIGGYQMLDILKRITKGAGEIKDIDRLKDISAAMQRASLCGLGQTAPNPIVSTIKHYEHEYRDHIENKRCASGTCKDLVQYSIRDAACKRCGLCMRVCPVGAISGSRDTGYVIDVQKCIKCGACFDACKFGAIEKK